MLFLCPSQVGAAPAAVRPQSMAESAVDAEFLLARLRGLGITGKRIVIVGMARRCCQQHEKVNDPGVRL